MRQLINDDPDSQRCQTPSSTLVTHIRHNGNWGRRNKWWSAEPIYFGEGIGMISAIQHFGEMPTNTETGMGYLNEMIRNMRAPLINRFRQLSCRSCTIFPKFTALSSTCRWQKTILQIADRRTDSYPRLMCETSNAS
jgi:hypothetical protein